ncbi:MAG TPA: hypothetical protein VHO90_06035 [Bacteroidales bacterium]|nr:hypothetical protein [Bacteroidales bacterium]
MENKETGTPRMPLPLDDSSPEMGKNLCDQIRETVILVQNLAFPALELPFPVLETAIPVQKSTFPALEKPFLVLESAIPVLEKAFPVREMPFLT